MLWGHAGVSELPLHTPHCSVAHPDTCTHMPVAVLYGSVARGDTLLHATQHPMFPPAERLQLQCHGLHQNCCWTGWREASSLRHHLSTRRPGQCITAHPSLHTSPPQTLPLSLTQLRCGPLLSMQSTTPRHCHTFPFTPSPLTPHP